ncbi:hypothetical protein SNEBB_008841 [Seison nebaliae]|nr:hypothetical protein SNEBB_008841 [Seison nebaliae]
MTSEYQMANTDEPGDQLVKKEKKDGFLKFLWNGKYRRFMGRDATSWVKISCFYFIFYAILASLYCLGVYVLYLITPADRPTLIGEQSVMTVAGMMPGIGFRPHPEITTDRISLVSKADQQTYANELEHYLKHDKEARKIVEDNSLDQSFYGAESKNPVLLLKLNKIFGWEPTAIADVKDRDLPDIVKDKKEDLVAAFGNDTLNSNDIFIDCIPKKRKVADKTPPKVEVEYFCEGDMSTKFCRYSGKNFPYDVGKTMKPVFIKIKPLDDNVDKVYMFCKAYAGNMDVTSIFASGGLCHFELIFNEE